MKMLFTSAAFATALAAAPAHAIPGKTGWQNPVVYAPPVGAPEVFVHYDCPTGYAAQSGGFIVAGTQATFGNGFTVTGNGPRLDVSPAYYGQWAWEFQWPNGGAPSGSSITLNVLCKKGTP